ncbi:MAG: DUF4240 domain-containing protein [Bacteroidota bacterium]
MASIPLKFQSLEELVGSLHQLDNATLNYLVKQLRKLQIERGITDEPLMLGEAQFWTFIDLIDWTKEADEQVLQPLVDALAKNNQATIYQFSERLAFYLHQLDGPAYTKILEESDFGFSADTFLYARCLAVAKGEDFYKKVLAEPKYMPINEDLEDLLYVAEVAFEQKTGTAFSYIPTINYESFSNQKLWGKQAVIL